MTDDFNSGIHSYRARMDREKAEIDAREAQKTIGNRVTAMVDSGGGWLECQFAHIVSRISLTILTSLRSRDARLLLDIHEGGQIQVGARCRGQQAGETMVTR